MGIAIMLLALSIKYFALITFTLSEGLIKLGLTTGGQSIKMA
jgi:hypothetical protein